jgi:hypothetical protein
MTNAKHTPGPWTISAVCTDEIIGEGGILVARAIQYGHDIIISHEERFSNARLIAAAPDLLEALIWALDALENLGITIEEMPETIIKARLAISKAEGRED